MTTSTGETTQLLGQMNVGNMQARNALIAHACRRLHRLTSRMLKCFPGVKRWEETDDVLNNSLLRLNKALSSVVLETSRHFWNLATRVIRRELIDMARHYQGPEGLGAHHHTDSEGRSPDDQGGPLQSHPEDRHESLSLEEWALFHEEVEKLPEDVRAVYDLIWYEGRTQEEAAVILNVSVRKIKRKWKSAKILLSRAMRK
jgi:RNA polymerase sigma factor (sigma-70 family)